MLKKVIIGLVVGFICGLLSSGGGVILLTSYLYVFKLGEKEARATTIFSMLIITAITSVIYLSYKNFDFILGFKCAIGGVIGSYFGSKLLNKMNTNSITFKIAFVLFLIFSAYCMLR